MKIKENEKAKKYQGPIIELIKLRKSKVMIMPLTVHAFETVMKTLEKELRELEIKRRTETIESTARILKKVLET